MSESGKFVIRPKVRFCQWEDEEEEEPFLPVRKPTIKNIVTVEKPYKILSLDDDNNDDDDNGGKLTEKREENSPVNYYPVLKNSDQEYFSPSVDSSFSSLSKDEAENPQLIQVDVHAEDEKIPPDFEDEAKAFSNSKEHLFTDTEFTTNSQQKILIENGKIDQGNKIFKRGNLSTIQEQSLEIPLNSTQEFEAIEEREETQEEQELKKVKKPLEEKEIPETKKKSVSTLSRRQLNSINRLSKAKSPKKFQNSQENLKIRSARPLGFIQRSSTSTRPKVAGVMPCLKSKVKANGKYSPMKKTVLRNISVKPKSKFFVTPGVSRPSRKELNFNSNDENGGMENGKFRGEKLSKPEYNSIMNTINKLKEVQKENIITDVEHLPPIYKSLVNGKVAHSLDFPPDEIIFKNLINLSIDETELPTRFTRSKDPEPRQRDAIPKLSDFFHPKYADEYCTAVCVKPRNSEQTENWNAFRVSDKIRSWKWNMDFVH
ncbi:uncharacterized protein LOC122512492 [Leptopilina heterotoma]|uniref:uncharacterized protein LOC122512492 n=1 Tax=Leptopilina heterotoma TaxID=63436 RepID=UPI001CA9E6A7|nr:uncharacterized protein LOC122512492 [Leptopilina heterotoma]